MRVAGRRAVGAGHAEGERDGCGSASRAGASGLRCSIVAARPRAGRCLRRPPSRGDRRATGPRPSSECPGRRQGSRRRARSRPGGTSGSPPTRICVLKRDYEDQVCSVVRTLELVGERWTLLIICDAFLGRRRFEQLQESLGIARNVLTEALPELGVHVIVNVKGRVDEVVRPGCDVHGDDVLVGRRGGHRRAVARGVHGGCEHGARGRPTGARQALGSAREGHAAKWLWLRAVAARRQPARRDRPGSGDPKESVSASNLAAGDYRVLVCGFANAASQPYNASLQIIARRAPRARAGDERSLHHADTTHAVGFQLRAGNGRSATSKSRGLRPRCRSRSNPGRQRASRAASGTIPVRSARNALPCETSRRRGATRDERGGVGS
jgi:HxlR-like helix-turn-helix protein